MLCSSFLDDHIENINLGDNFNFYMIQGLHSGSEYTVTINPIFGDTEGPVTTTKAKTCKYKLLKYTYKCNDTMRKTFNFLPPQWRAVQFRL